MLLDCIVSFYSRFNTDINSFNVYIKLYEDAINACSSYYPFLQSVSISHERIKLEQVNLVLHLYLITLFAE